ncbi:DegT/DnrJ/EryC1/StrS family aminotransferase [Salipiger mucosus]|uniref:UDP-4-amino-4-deoxy-L-arabinose--oxoglutarate aminotransferase n=1 Tax=Salipiger mucosus DSM 16094 TaxID=1123237 RepID=S9SHG1_9RHOB|nr:DegT/DnrJ/EryC1/StrS family aminotransferase [Salipiger mucosus]EPX85744.1 UDP-4-amino-4-deoxy-L-arabinose--oxoglutarate aminotransferase [Salipiger mucosus DSM 16094]
MIPFLDLRRQYAGIADDLEASVLATLRSGQYVLGEPVECFEENFATYCGTRHAVAVSTGTSALQLALLTAGVGPGDEVITVPTTFVATVAAILYCGATPVLVDVDPETLTMDPAQCARAVTPRTKAILPVHFHGRLADMAALDAIAYANRLTLIEDSAQAHGARRDGQRAGSFGAMGCFSFYPGKNLGAAGEGGAVTTNDDGLASRLRALRDWGQLERGVHALRGYNYRMDAIQGAVLGVKLRHLDGWTAARRRIAGHYDAALAPEIRRPATSGPEDHVYHVYAIESEDRDALRRDLTDAGIGTNVHYMRPVHLQPAYADLANGPGSFPVAEAYAARTLSLPIFPELTGPEVEQVAAAVNALSERTHEPRERAIA